MGTDNRHAIATEGLYEGKPSLTLKWRPDSKYPFSFGITKAQLILACLEEIHAFVEAHPDAGGGGRNNRPQGPRRQDEPLTDRQDEPLRGSSSTPPGTASARPGISGNRPC